MDRDIIDVRSPNTLVRDDLSYLAGLIDGEGNVDFYSNGNGYLFKIEIGMTDEVVIDWLKDNFGGGKRTVKLKSEHHKPAWRWYVYGNKAIELYLRIYPLLHVKRVPDLEPTINS